MILGVTGLVILFGKYVLLPVIGYTLFAWLASLSKNLHNFVGPIFVGGLPSSSSCSSGQPAAALRLQVDREVRRHVRGEHVPSGRFNAGEKALFWGRRACCRSIARRDRAAS